MRSDEVIRPMAVVTLQNPETLAEKKTVCVFDTAANGDVVRLDLQQQLVIPVRNAQARVSSLDNIRIETRSFVHLVVKSLN